jgi:Zn-dependent protease with chaperone function
MREEDEYMMGKNRLNSQRVLAWLMAVALFATPIAALAQTQISAPSNKYSVSDDVKLGREAAAQVRQQMPLINDPQVQEYINSVGRRLAAAIPPQFQHPEFNYTFQVVNAKDINAFALPGGPTFVNRGMIDAARNEGELAGVMAHELSHVALRHATAQATETQKYQIGSVLGQIAGAVVGGGVGSVISQGSQMGFGLQTLKYSRKYETQADILGAQIMARAGYDPHDLANVFKTLEAQGGSSGPQFMSSHPNPGNRFERINQEAAMLRVNPNRATQDTAAFRQVQARLNGSGRALTSEDIARNQQRYPNQSNPNQSYPNNTSDQYPRSERVAYPSSRYRTFNGGNLFQVSVPENWQQVGGGDSITYAPAGGYGSVQGQPVFTHGAMIGVTNSQGASLRNASDDFINGLMQSNSYLRRSNGYQRATIDGNTALMTQLAGRSPITGQNEVVNVYTTPMRDGNLFYVIGVAPQQEYGTYQNTFQNIVRSLRLNNR